MLDCRGLKRKSVVLSNRPKKKPGLGGRRKRKDFEKKKNRGKRCWQKQERLKRRGDWKKRPKGRQRKKLAER